MDTLSKAERSRRMSLVRSKDTKPELRVRQIAHRLGYRFRLHQTHLPGKPDLVFKRLQKVIFILWTFLDRRPGYPRSLGFWSPLCRPVSDTRYWRGLETVGADD
jgi:DNA mismatch endonuclease (patch repair protein)